jgi:hypothetical protein
MQRASSPCLTSKSVSPTDQTLSCAARAHVATAKRHAACLHLNSAMLAACRRPRTAERAGSAGGPKIVGPKDAWLFQKPPSARLLACWTPYSAKCARARASARDLCVQRIRASPPQRKHSARCATVVAGGFGTEVLPLVRTSQSNPPFVSALRRRRQAIVGSRAGLREAPVGRTTLPLHPTGRRCLGRR